jgi:hypothetical protein
MPQLQVETVPIQRRNTRLKVLGLAAALVGIFLHSFQMLVNFEAQSRSLSIALLVWSCLPYLFGLLLIFVLHRAVIPLFGVVGPLIVDLLNHYFVFIAPLSSSAGLNLFWIPLWNMLVVQPIGCAIGWLVWRSKVQRARVGTK